MTTCREAGDLDGVRYAMGTAIRLLEFHGDAEKADFFTAYWEKLDPGGPGR